MDLPGHPLLETPCIFELFPSQIIKEMTNLIVSDNVWLFGFHLIDDNHFDSSVMMDNFPDFFLISISKLTNRKARQPKANQKMFDYFIWEYIWRLVFKWQKIWKKKILQPYEWNIRILKKLFWSFPFILFLTCLHLWGWV